MRTMSMTEAQITKSLCKELCSETVLILSAWSARLSEFMANTQRPAGLYKDFQTFLRENHLGKFSLLPTNMQGYNLKPVVW